MKKAALYGQSKNRLTPRVGALLALGLAAAIAAFVFAGCGDSAVDKGVSNIPWTGTDADVPVTAEFEPAGAEEIEEGTLTDARNGKSYRTVKIGGAAWMAENLNYETDSSWCYGKDDSNCDTYGRLYAWSVAMTACPEGWHLPSVEEWTALIDAAGGATPAYAKLRSVSGWNAGETVTDEYKFSALPGGYYDEDGSFKNVKQYGYWWSATEAPFRGYAQSRRMWHDEARVSGGNEPKNYGYSVRCVEGESHTSIREVERRVY